MVSGFAIEFVIIRRSEYKLDAFQTSNLVQFISCVHEVKNQFSYFQKHPSRGILRKRCSENMQQTYRRTPMKKCDFNKVAIGMGVFL